MAIAVGTMVQLVSGGPKMMISSLRDQFDDVVSCEWFVDSDLRRDAFDLINLVVVGGPLNGSKTPSE
jgi:uncharacterized protein YodC (DUF2158 family)